MKTLLVSNCQTLGFKNCFNFLAPDMDFDALALSEIGSKKIDFNQYGTILSTPEFINKKSKYQTLANKALELIKQNKLRHIRLIPMAFNAFHPDICYLSYDNTIPKGPMGDYHSKIIFACFINGINENFVARLFTSKVFRELSFFSYWEPATKHLNNSYKHVGFRADNYLPNWSRYDHFMHTPNHPSIRCIYDISKLFLSELNIQFENVSYEHLPIIDNLLLGPAWPLYPEIGNKLGLKGNYIFKPDGSCITLSLNEMIHQSYECYRQLNPGLLKAHPIYTDSVNLVVNRISELSNS
jgi:hypothetical protein